VWFSDYDRRRNSGRNRGRGSRFCRSGGRFSTCGQLELPNALTQSVEFVDRRGELQLADAVPEKADFGIEFGDSVSRGARPEIGDDRKGDEKDDDAEQQNGKKEA
jgi:hypothetical protein